MIRKFVPLLEPLSPACVLHCQTFTFYRFFGLISTETWPIIQALLTRLTRRKASVGLFFGLHAMPVEPAVKRAIAFVDGQDLFHNARLAYILNKKRSTPGNAER